VGGALRVAGMNLLNLFNTFDGLPDNVDNCANGVGGAAADCRGADTAAEFARQWPKTVAAIIATEADIIGVNEIENDGYGPDSAIAFLVEQLNAATAPGVYAFIDVDAATGQVNALGGDAIKVGLIYKPARVTPIGQTAALNTVEFVNGGDASPRSRPSLAQAFQQNSNGARFVVDINHLKSKGSACDAPDAGDGQGNCNIVRVNAANELMTWLAGDPTGVNEADILLIGDYNSYALEDPITVIKNAGFTNLIESFLGPDAYSYVFDGQWGYLDHALGSASIVSQVTNVGDYHINADEPSVLDYNTDFKTLNLQTALYAPDQFRVSDHDPVLVGLDLRNDPPVASAGGPYSANEGESVALSASGYDPDGAPVTFAWDLDNDNIFETAGQSVTFNAVDGAFAYTVNVQVTDETGPSTVASATVNVANVAPSLAPLTAPVDPVAAGVPVNASANFTDPGVLDTHTAAFDWGDGVMAAGAVSEANGSGSASGSHSYTTPGIYTISLTVTDKDGGAATQVFEYVVVYDPSGGFVTGGGWIDSPAGAYVADPTLMGAGTFGFVARYKKGQSAPDGQTEFQFKAGDLNFHSSSYEWLVVAGPNAKFKGVGAINGAGNYGFMLTATDGQVNGGGGVDKFRIKIWDKNNGDAVVYDNQAGEGDDSHAGTALGGGSIVIHNAK
jgi:PKD repeat protein